MHGSWRILDVLIDSGANLDSISKQSDGSERTPLIMAALGGDESTTRRLLHAGASPQLACQIYPNFLAEVRDAGGEEMVQLLSRYGASW